MSEAPPTSESTSAEPKQSRWSIWVIFLVLAGVYILFSMPRDSGIDWTADLDRGLKQASENNQFALVMFSAPWCDVCTNMKRRVLSQAKVRDSLKNWVPISVDIKKQPRIQQTYMVEAVPVFITFSPKGNQIKRIEGAMSAEEFIQMIQSVEKENQ